MTLDVLKWLVIQQENSQQHSLRALRSHLDALSALRKHIDTFAESIQGDVDSLNRLRSRHRKTSPSIAQRSETEALFVALRRHIDRRKEKLHEQHLRLQDAHEKLAVARHQLLQQRARTQTLGNLQRRRRALRRHRNDIRQQQNVAEEINPQRLVPRLHAQTPRAR